MEYLKKVLGIDTVYKESIPVSLPNYITERYNVQNVRLSGIDALFVYPRNELEDIHILKKQFNRIVKEAGLPAVLVLTHIIYREKEYLIRDRIPFIVEDKQIYLPFMGTYLQERYDSERAEQSTLLPSAQLILLNYIYSGRKEMMTSELSKGLGLTPTSISRASKQLVELGLLQSEKRGVQKVIFSDKEPADLFLFAKKRLLSPVKKTIYVNKDRVKKNLPLSSYSALSEYSMLNVDPLTYLATDSISKWEGTAATRLKDSDIECAIELWRYDPNILSDGKCVDRLSLALALENDKDERVEEAVAEMLEELWRDIDGKRNR